MRDRKGEAHSTGWHIGPDDSAGTVEVQQAVEVSLRDGPAPSTHKYTL